MEKRAVIVGVNRYQDDQITNLDWAVSDATLMKGVLDDCGFSKTRLLTSEMSSIKVDNHTIEHSVRELREGLGPEDLLVFYFAGHGYQDAEWGHLLLPANVVYEDLKSDKSYRRVKAALRVSDLEELMGDQGAGRLILLDACRTSVESANRDLDSGMSPLTARDLVLVVEKATDRHSSNQERGPVGIICGCSENQKSYELKDKGGVFTHGLIADLKATREAGESYRFPTRFESIQERMNQLMAAENRSWKQQPFCKVEGGVIELLAGKGEDVLAEELRKKEEEEKEKARQAAEAAALEEERRRQEEAAWKARSQEKERQKREEADRLAKAKAAKEREIQESIRKQKEVEEAERRGKANAKPGEETKSREEAARKANVGEAEIQTKRSEEFNNRQALDEAKWEQRLKSILVEVGSVTKSTEGDGLPEIKGAESWKPMWVLIGFVLALAIVLGFGKCVSNNVDKRPIEVDARDGYLMGGEYGVKVSWKAVNGVKRYVLFRKELSGKAKLEEIKNFNSRSGSMEFLDESAEPMKTYQYFVKGEFSGESSTELGEGDEGQWEPPAPNAPQRLKLTPSTGKDGKPYIQLNWRADLSNDHVRAKKYELYRGKTPQSLSPIHTRLIDGDNYLDGPLSPETNYYYGLVGISRSNKRSRISEIVGVRTLSASEGNVESLTAIKSPTEDKPLGEEINNSFSKIIKEIELSDLSEPLGSAPKLNDEFQSDESPPQKGEDYTIKELELEMVWIDPGTFLMGSPENELKRDIDEKQHEVTLTEGFWIGKYEVTQEEWKTLMGNNPSHFRDTGIKAPLENVSWEDTQSFIKKLNLKESSAGRLPDGYAYLLPTEAQWEYSCRSNTQTRFYWGVSSDESFMKKYCWYEKNADEGYWTNPHADQEGSQPVGSKLPNAWGLYDMSGNVWEWCEDWEGGYPFMPATNPRGPVSGIYRIFRGGSWRYLEKSCRSANRDFDLPSYKYNDLGFRLALRPAPKNISGIGMSIERSSEHQTERRELPLK